MIRPTTLRMARERVAKVYEFWFNPIGWAFVTVCDATGQLAINSDWGDFQHCWLARAFGSVSVEAPADWHPPMAPPSRPRTLTEFLAEMDAVDYVADKLTGHDRRRFEVVDTKATLAELRRRIVEKRREQSYSFRMRETMAADRRAARAAWDAAAEFVDELAPSGDNFWEVYERHVDDLRPYLADDEPWEVMEKRDTRNVDVLRELLLPTLFAHLRGEVAVAPELPPAHDLGGESG